VAFEESPREHRSVFTENQLISGIIPSIKVVVNEVGREEEERGRRRCWFRYMVIVAMGSAMPVAIDGLRSTHVIATAREKRILGWLRVKSMNESNLSHLLSLPY
jgi:hypothetical protein